MIQFSEELKLSSDKIPVREGWYRRSIASTDGTRKSHLLACISFI